VNSELADILGNFVFRTHSFTERFFDSQVPEFSNPTEFDLQTLSEIENQKEKIEKAYESFKFREAIHQTMHLARIGNRYFTETEPWKTRKENPEACGNTLYVCLQISAALSVLFEPVLPHKMQRLRNQLAVPENITWDEVSDHILSSGLVIEKDDILFEKIEDDVVEAQVEKLKERAGLDEEEKEESTFPELKEEINFNQFMSLDIRAGKIVEASEIEKSDKLIQTTVDLGFETRTILAGVKKHLKPEELIGQRVCVVANLAPKKMMGIESNGMILMGEDSNGKLHFVETEAEPGSPIT
ncbi:MAG: methionine--tRNA ligase subunit beta, partial [Bacteroidetes bacterium]|nr:methionine--tRNA ligase subunit beta [Bacteroidota bacterium]